MFDDMESDDELEVFINNYQPSTLSKKELNNAKARIRGALNREAKESQKRSQEMASYIINHAEQRRMIESSKHHERGRKAHGVAVTVSRLSSSVLASIGVRAPINVSKNRYASVASASTNFEVIEIGINPDNYDETNRDALSALIHLTKGLVYHEGGHIKWTTPFPRLIELSNRYGLTMSEKYRLQRAWNVLEDQRMETAMCSISPIMGKYFTSIVMNVVINFDDLGANWPWIAGRTYIPQDIRQAIRDAAEARDIHAIVDDMTRCVMGYRKSKCPNEMMNYVIEFNNLLDKWGGNPRGADKHDMDSCTSDSYAMPDSIPDVPDHNGERPSEGVLRPVKAEDGDPSDNEDAEQEPESPGADSDNSKGLGAPPSENKQPVDTEQQRKIEDVIKDRAVEEMTKSIGTVGDDEIDEFISSVNEHSSKDVLVDPTITIMNDYEISETVKVTNSMVSVLERLVVQVDPTWKSYMEEGVIDPTLFRLREPGDTNFWSGLDGDGNNGHDLALSVLIDSSGSMGGKMHTASIAALGIRKACDQLEIPCTITTFNDDVYMMARADEPVDYIRVAATGGTSVTNALMALDDQRHDKTYHMVVILTDGEWSDVTDVRLWSNPTRSITIVGFGYGMDRYISNKSADHCIVIENLLELPGIVTDSLVNHLV